MISSDLSQREGGAEPSLSWVPSPGGPASPRFSAHSPASLLGTLSPWLCLLSPGLCSLPLGPERETPRTEGRVGSGCTELELREPGSSGTGPAQLAACSDHMGYSPSRPAPVRRAARITLQPGCSRRPSAEPKPGVLLRSACGCRGQSLLVPQALGGDSAGRQEELSHTLKSSVPWSLRRGTPTGRASPSRGSRLEYPF